MTPLVRASVAAALLAFLAAPAVAAAGVAPLDVPAPPEPVVAWLLEEGPAAVTKSETSGLAADELAEAAIGSPTSVHVWSEDFIAGGDEGEPAVPSGEWVAPVTLGGAGVGAIVVVEGDAGVADHRLVWDEDLGSALVAFQATTFILDEATSGWFRLGGDILTPVTVEARDVLAGSIDVNAYQPFLVARYGGGGGDEPAAPAEGDAILPRPVMVAAGVAVGVLALVGAVVWIRRPEAVDE